MQRLEENEFARLCQAVAGEALLRLAEHQEDGRADGETIAKLKRAIEQDSHERVGLKAKVLELQKALDVALEALTDKTHDFESSLHEARRIIATKNEENKDLLKRLAALKPGA